MKTNATIPPDTPLAVKGNALIAAAYAYWQEYQKQFGSAAVVWLQSDDGHFVLFTRAEYRRQLMEVVDELESEAGLVHPFEKETP